MTTLKDDIAAARKSGMSDDDILKHYKDYDPAKASDIDAALKLGTTQSDLLDALGDYDATYGPAATQAPQGVVGKAIGAVQEGTADELQGLGATAKETIGPGAVSNTLMGAGNAVAPQGYQPASTGLGDATKGFADRAGYIPRSLVEGAPGLATDIAAGAAGARIGGAVGALGGPFAEVTVPAGAAIGGALGFGGSYLLRNYGKDAERAAAARTGDPNATPNSEDKARAIAAGVASAALSRVGVSQALGEGVATSGAQAVLSAASGLGKAAAVDAGTGAATDALNTTILDRKNPADDPAGLALAGAQGGVTGAGLRAAGGARDTVQSLKFRDIDPVHGDALADLYAGQDFSTPAKAYDAVVDVDRQLGTLADHWHSATQPQLKALQEANGYTDDTDAMVKLARSALGSGNVVDPNTLDTLRQRLGDYHEGSNLVDTLTLQNTQNKVKSVGNFRPGSNGTGTFGSGISDTALANTLLSPVGKLGKYGPLGAAADLAVAHLAPSLAINPAIGLGIAAGQLGARGAGRMIDAALGNGNPLAQFASRFGSGGDSEGATDAASPPSFRQVQQDAKAQAQAKAKATADAGKTDAIAERTGQQVAALAQQAVLSQRVRQDASDAKATKDIANDTAAQVGRLARSTILQERAQDPMMPGATRDAVTMMRARVAALRNAQGAVAEPKAPPMDTLIPGVTKADATAMRAQIGAISNAQRAGGSDGATREALRRPQAAGTAPKGQPQGPAAEASETRTVVRNGKSVTYSTAGVQDVARYEGGITHRMDVRHEAIAKAMEALPPETHGTLDTIHNSLNVGSMKAAKAKELIEDLAAQHPEHRDAIVQRVATPAVMSTFPDHEKVSNPKAHHGTSSIH